MTINGLVEMAKRIHDVEGWDLGSPARQGLTPEQGREKRNQFWAFVIGCAYWGHPVYNTQPDTQWHLKKGDPTRPQTDDVATSMPSRHYWDCIPGAGADGYSFAATPHGPLPAEQIVYAPPKPDGSQPEPAPQPPVIALPGREEMMNAGQWLHRYYKAPEGLQRPDGLWKPETPMSVAQPDWEGIGAWLFDVYLPARVNGKNATEATDAVVKAIRQTDEWKSKHPHERP